MSDTRTPNDLLANILSGKKPAKESPVPAPASPQGSPPVSAPPTPRQAVAVESPPAIEKVKATFYLPEQTTNEVEEMWIRVRQMVTKDKRGSVSKSYIVEVALALLIEEFRLKGSDSRLFDNL